MEVVNTEILCALLNCTCNDREPPFHAESFPTAEEISVMENNELNPWTSERPHEALTYRQWRFWLMNPIPTAKNNIKKLIPENECNYLFPAIYMFVKCHEKGNTFEILRPWGTKQNRLCSLKIESRFMMNVNMGAAVFKMI